jgi:hypothetical protein
MSLGVQGPLSVGSHEPNNANERLELDDGVSIARYYSFGSYTEPTPKDWDCNAVARSRLHMSTQFLKLVRLFLHNIGLRNARISVPPHPFPF